jgi:hypothetical protein
MLNLLERVKDKERELENFKYNTSLEQLRTELAELRATKTPKQPEIGLLDGLKMFFDIANMGNNKAGVNAQQIGQAVAGVNLEDHQFTAEETQISEAMDAIRNKVGDTATAEGFTALSQLDINTLQQLISMAKQMPKE